MDGESGSSLQPDNAAEDRLLEFSNAPSSLLQEAPGLVAYGHDPVALASIRRAT